MTMQHKPNRLIGETSPYLLQHAHNPVDWRPWGAEAFEAARREDKPVFLSVGYAACHWCHVMERESFENEMIAAFLNEHFISVKVDREERPDIDDCYMAAVQMVSGAGGWPMTVFLDPDGRPFYGGTYFPPDDRHGRPGFLTLIEHIDRLWRERRAEVEEGGAEITGLIARAAGAAPGPDGDLPGRGVIERAVGELTRRYDADHGGFGGAPKFPPSMALELILRQWRRTGGESLAGMARTTLDAMVRGGIYDQIGGGFARYSTDAEWFAPHFEKMLYDNALLAPRYFEMAILTGDEAFQRVGRETLDWILREMTDPAGGFHATLDADSEGAEGKYYLWTPGEIREALDDDDDAELVCAFYGVVEGGNWPEGGGGSILSVASAPREFACACGFDPDSWEARLTEMRVKLLEARGRRVPPGRDDKILTGWNGLAISAMTCGARACGEARYLEAAENAARFILDAMRRPEGGLLRSWRAGRAHVYAFLEDYACFINGLIDIYETAFDPAWLTEAAGLAERMAGDFHDDEFGGFFQSDGRDGTLVVRLKDLNDGATPSGNAMAALALDRLGAHLGREDYRAIASRTIAVLAERMRRFPSSHHQALCVLDRLLNPTVEVAIAGDPEEPEVRSMLLALWGLARPDFTLAAGLDGGSVILKDRPMRAGRPAVYICRDCVCREPVSETGEMLALLES